MDATQTRVAEILKTQDLSKATISAKSDTAGSISRVPVGEYITASDIFDRTKLAVAATLSKGGQFSESNGGANVPIDGPGSGALYCIYNDVPLSQKDLRAIALNNHARREMQERAAGEREAGKVILEKLDSEILAGEFQDELADTPESVVDQEAVKN